MLHKKRSVTIAQIGGYLANMPFKVTVVRAFEFISDTTADGCQIKYFRR
jgi:hypothetical protein